MKNFSNKTEKGFTLIEAMVSIAILAISVTAVIVATGQGIFNLSRVKADIVAQYLAQEAVEAGHVIRNDLVLSGLTFDQFVGDLSSCTVNNACWVDTSAGSINVHTCDGPHEDCTTMVVDDTGKHRSNVEIQGDNILDSVYTRSIHVEEQAAGVLEYTATVTYDLGAGARAVENVVYLTDWVNIFAN
jgi:prepilin-type N-terminal cleavage/methylation domain-containing protein